VNEYGGNTGGPDGADKIDTLDERRNDPAVLGESILETLFMKRLVYPDANPATCRERQQWRRRS